MPNLKRLTSPEVDLPVNGALPTRPTKLYPAILREVANLIEAGRVLEVNAEALIEAAEYVKRRQLRALSRRVAGKGRRQ